MSKRVKDFKVETISFGDTDETGGITQVTNDEDFFNEFIKLRRPVKIVNSSNKILNIDNFKLANLEECLNWHEGLMIEKKAGGGFGNGNKRVKMTFGEFIKELRSGNDDYYLTTQYDEHQLSDGDEDEEDDDEEEEEDEDEEEQEDDDDEYELDKEFSNNLKPEELSSESPVAAELQEQPDSDSDFDFDNLKDDYEEDEEEQDEDEEDGGCRHIKELFQPPLTNIYNKIPTQPLFFETLVPQQINLWMGLSKQKSNTSININPEIVGDNVVDKSLPNGTSSGLHHDHADNLYILIQGHKRFTIFSPFDAYNLYTIGKVFKIYQNGVIDYEEDESSPNWKHINDDGSIIDHEERIIAKVKEDLPQGEIVDPPSFSKIPPILLHLKELEELQQLPKSEFTKLVNFTNKYFPKLLDLSSSKIWLNPGDMLYLPAGWFHEVLSFGHATTNQPPPSTTDNDVHIAINYWFIPPNNLQYNKPYKSDTWMHEFKLMSRV